MSDELELSISELRNKRREQEAKNGDGQGTRSHHEAGSAGPQQSTRIFMGGGSARPPGMSSPAAATPFNLFRIAEILARRWIWLLFGALLLGSAAMAVAWAVTGSSAKVALIRRETLNAFGGGADGMLARPLTEQTMFGLMTAPEIMWRASQKADPPISADALGRAVRVHPERNPDFVTLSVSGKRDRQTLAAWANLYAAEVVDYMREVQTGESAFVNSALQIKLADLQGRIQELDSELLHFATEAEVVDFDRELETFLTSLHSADLNLETAKVDLETVNWRLQMIESEMARHQTAPANDELTQANRRLQELLLTRRDAHPDVARQRAIIQQMEAQTVQAVPVAAAGGFGFGSNPLANQLTIELINLRAQRQALSNRVGKLELMKARVQERSKSLSRRSVEYAGLKARRNQLEITRSLYEDRQRQAQMVQDNALGYFRIFAQATPDSVSGRSRLVTVGLMTFVGAFLGFLVAALLALLTEVMDGRIKTASDVQRVTKLPLLASLGDLRHMAPAEQVSWAFRTLTILQGKLSASPDQSLVCGFISSRHGEGRSTWINLLVSAASQRGLRVLTIATRDQRDASPFEASASASAGAPAQDPNSSILPVGPSTTLNTNVLAFPDQVVEQFADPKAQPLVHIPLPGWVWNLERRKQWSKALMHWAKIENLVLLVELPPACQPESVLLAEHLPQIIWLAGSGQPDAQETAMQLETLRHARCNLVGSVLNKEPSSFWTGQLASWMRRFGMALLCLFTATSWAAELNESEENPAPGLFSFSVSQRAKESHWLQRLTLGPGDAVDISMFGQPDSVRTNVVVTPDGFLSYLQVQQLPATGRTIDELRAQLDEELEHFYLAPRTMVVPVAFNSKKYFVLGKVGSRGVYNLDRPLTIMEAVARARGLETGLVERNTVEIADLSRSFLVRQGERVPVDFHRLFYEGDFSQNLVIEPDDYLYFGSSAFNEVYMLGEVMQPGLAVLNDRTTLISVLTARGGFTPGAYRKKILIIRGSFENPETFVVDATAILNARAPDFRLQARDIVYVSIRPWARVEELMDIAAQSFIQGAITGWVGGNIGPVFTSPILPRL